MTNKLQQYFPMIRTKEDILAEINSSYTLSGYFYAWTVEQREEFLNFCSGAKGVKVLYDSFGKEVLNPERAPERLEDFLSVLLQKEVKILYALPNDNTRIADENTLLVTDIVVELADGSIANVEVQKIGYKFPGQRSACYSADMLLRQYKRIRSSQKSGFHYEAVQSVYTIVLFEKSPAEFHDFPEDYIHCFCQKSDTGLTMELLQKYIFVPLDIFKRKIHNTPIESRLEAWLLFFCEDDPERIAELIEAYPDFKFMYEDIYRICRNMEDAMGFFSEELKILDRNTVQLMIDEMQDELDEKKSQLEKTAYELTETEARLENATAELNSTTAELNSTTAELNSTTAELNSTTAELNSTTAELNSTTAELNSTTAELNSTTAELNSKTEELNKMIAALEENRCLNRLLQKLAEAERTAEIPKVMADEALRERLLREFQIK